MNAAATSPQWVTATMLQTLASNGIDKAGQIFTGYLLSDWLGNALTAEQRVHATSRLCSLAFLKHSIFWLDTVQVDTYTLTPEGAEAVRAAAAGHVRKSGPKGSREPNPVRPTDLSSRLWHLLRMRTMIDADSAARVLCDAGAEDFERKRSTLAKTLRRWALAGAVSESAKRVHAPDAPPSSNGFKRYVLVNDAGPMPPRWRPIVRAAQGARA